jgi:hypothetical protein
MCISRQFNQLGVIVIPQVLITLGQDHNALGIKGPHSTLIMGHEHHSPAIAAQCTQDLLSASRVKVVGRFIEEENIGTRHHERGKGQPGLLTTGQDRNKLVCIITTKEECAQNAAALTVSKVGSGTDERLQDRLCRVEGFMLLRVVANPRAMAQENLPGVR